MDFTKIKIIEIPKELQEELHQKRMNEIWGSEVKPVCANCGNLIETANAEIYSCRCRPGTIPKSIADNLSCVRSHGTPDFIRRKDR